MRKTIIVLVLLALGTMAYAGDTERAVTIQEIQEQINSTQDMIDKMENPDFVVWIQLYNNSKIKEDGSIYFVGDSIRTIDITGRLWECGIDAQQSKKEWAEKLKDRKRLLERKLHDMLWCR